MLVRCMQQKTCQRRYFVQNVVCVSIASFALCNCVARTSQNANLAGQGGRRLYWGWTAYTPPAQGVMSLPRELTWHPELQQLVHSAVPELSALRELPPLANTQLTKLTPGVSHSLFTTGGRQAEVQATFALPIDQHATLGDWQISDILFSNELMPVACFETRQ